MEMAADELFFKPKLKVFSDEQITRLHDATLEVLERTGFKITHSRALEVLAGGIYQGTGPDAGGVAIRPLPAQGAGYANLHGSSRHGRGDGHSPGGCTPKRIRLRLIRISS